jgi:hypothetical protein
VDDVLNQLVKEGLLTAESAEGVIQAIAGGMALDDALRSANGSSEEKILRWLSTHYGIPFADLEKDAEKLAPSKELLGKFPARILIDRRMMPVGQQNGDGVAVLTSRVFDTTGLDELRLATGMDVHPVLAPSTEIDRFMKKYLGVGADTLQSMGITGEEQDVKILEDQAEDDMDLTQAAQDASIIKFVNQMMAEALDMRATDVHIEPFENQLRVRYRVDGVLQEANLPPEVRKLQAAIVSRIKILSHLDIAEKRVPQDGRIRLRVAGREIDLRVSVIPMIHGEAVVLRILDRGDALLGLEHLGMSKRDNSVWTQVLDLPHGIILVTGPTGSGKTTTLYAALSKINNDRFEDHHDGRPGGVSASRDQPDSGECQSGPDVRGRAAGDFASRPGRRADRRNPRPRNGGDRRAGVAHGPPGVQHAAHQRRSRRDDAHDRHGRRAVSGASSLEMVAAQRLVRLICKHCKEEDAQGRDSEAPRSLRRSRAPDDLSRPGMP